MARESLKADPDSQLLEVDERELESLSIKFCGVARRCMHLLEQSGEPRFYNFLPNGTSIENASFVQTADDGTRTEYDAVTFTIPYHPGRWTTMEYRFLFVPELNKVQIKISQKYKELEELLRGIPLNLTIDRPNRYCREVFDILASTITNVEAKLNDARQYETLPTEVFELRERIARFFTELLLSEALKIEQMEKLLSRFGELFRTSK